MQSSSAVHVCSDLEEIILDHFNYLLELAASSLSEELLAEKVGDLVHHQLVKGGELRAQQQVEEILHELALGLLLKLVSFRHGFYIGELLELEGFFIDLGLEQLETVLVLGKEVSFRN